MPKATVVRADKGRRVDCRGNCGSRILLHYNPNGLCRKCDRSRRRGLLRIDSRKARGTL